jgi:hypothetical protein
MVDHAGILGDSEQPLVEILHDLDRGSDRHGLAGDSSRRGIEWLRQQRALARKHQVAWCGVLRGGIGIEQPDAVGGVERPDIDPLDVAFRAADEIQVVLPVRKIPRQLVRALLRRVDLRERAR